MRQILEAIQSGASGDDIAGLPLPESYRAAVVRRDDVEMFEGLDSADKDPRKSLHVQDVAVPELGPDEAYVAVMASSINFNTVWTSIFEPLPTFGFLDRLDRLLGRLEAAWWSEHLCFAKGKGFALHDLLAGATAGRFVIHHTGRDQYAIHNRNCTSAVGVDHSVVIEREGARR